jgi:tRNA threonylcarbamoyladenosine biosynthesis protein TsaE
MEPRMNRLEIQLPDESATVLLGKALAAALPEGGVLALLGTLGAGKTRLTQAIGAALGVPDGEVVSPTFVLIQEYEGKIPVFHFDAYRLKSDDEFLALGADEYFARPGLTIIEWADRVERCLPQEYLEVELRIEPNDARSAQITAVGNSYQRALQEISVALTQK